MEEGCFSSLKSGKGLDPKINSEKIMLGLKYPIYIITSSFKSPHLPDLQNALEK